MGQWPVFHSLRGIPSPMKKSPVQGRGAATRLMRNPVGYDLLILSAVWMETLAGCGIVFKKGRICYDKDGLEQQPI
jgi:hypothetical protein